MYADIDVHGIRSITDFPENGVKCISKRQSHCPNMTFSEKGRYDSLFQKVTHKGGLSAMNYIKRSHNEQSLSVSVGNIYSDDQLVHIFFNNFHQGGKYTVYKANHQAE